MKINTEKQLKLANGSEINLTLNYGSLYKLEAKEPKLVEEYFNIQAKEKALNEFDITKVLYVAYRCADNNQSILSLEDFLALIPENRNTIMQMYAELLYPKN